MCQKIICQFWMCCVCAYTHTHTNTKHIARIAGYFLFSSITGKFCPFLMQKFCPHQHTEFLVQSTRSSHCIRKSKRTHTNQLWKTGWLLKVTPSRWIGEPDSLAVKDSVAMDLRATGRSEIKREPSEIHIPCLEGCDGFNELIYRM